MASESDWDNSSVSNISTSPSYYDNFDTLEDSEWDNCSIVSFSLPLPRNDENGYYDEYAPSLLSWRSLLYEFLDGEILCRCTHCDWPPPPSEDMWIEHYTREDIHYNRKVEGENYGDIRSAARARQLRKRQDRRRCHSYRCRKEGQACADRINTKNKRKIERFAEIDRVEESMNRSIELYCLFPSRDSG